VPGRGTEQRGQAERLACAQTAATCPCGTELVTVAAAEAGTNACPAREARITSIRSRREV